MSCSKILMKTKREKKRCNDGVRAEDSPANTQRQQTLYVYEVWTHGKRGSEWMMKRRKLPMSRNDRQQIPGPSFRLPSRPPAVHCEGWRQAMLTRLSEPNEQVRGRGKFTTMCVSGEWMNQKDRLTGQFTYGQ